ncbi:hypothetical protein TRP8649_01086 [Pelagimonas phthalicica]|uniref:Uncharacterized protein n=1 Tax=Pelagimonas phthalicica TaxID=1037362 RepID=A0A238J9C7_9RHOB|nr:hypothetical protein [Pelagimonas phthalicica]TDS94486.1 hypothetical protein CLV87_0986 [Pelagimonas phthalicica]SMX26985.1 hypothetical protein TRP8649_01086 [Pelagimonas phthalicica]
MTQEFTDRVRFHDDLQAMEVDFYGFHFPDSKSVNAAYDCIEDCIAQSGHKHWFFLVNLHGLQVDQSAWPAYAKRGKALNLAHSMGTVRFDASEETAARISAAAQTENFDPNLFNNREDAIERIRKLPSRRSKGAENTPNHSAETLSNRISFDPSTGIMEADLSHLTLYHGRDANDLYDQIRDKIAQSGQDKWYFLINYEACKIEPGAWVQFAHRGKTLNKAHSLGTVRFAPGSETEDEIRQRATSQEFRPNIRNTREEALERIAEMKASEHA